MAEGPAQGCPSGVAWMVTLRVTQLALRGWSTFKAFAGPTDRLGSPCLTGADVDALRFLQGRRPHLRLPVWPSVDVDLWVTHVPLRGWRNHGRYSKILSKLVRSYFPLLYDHVRRLELTFALLVQDYDE